MPLSLPPRTLHLEPIDIRVEDLVRGTRYSSGEPHFGSDAAHRIEDPRRIAKRRFGTCYLGLGLESAFAESVLLDEVPTVGHFWVPPEALTSRFGATFKGPTLRFANMTGPELRRSGVGLELTTEMPYATPQR